MALADSRMFHRPAAAARMQGASLALWAAGGIVAAAVLLPVVYLAIRTAGAGTEVLDVLLRPRIGTILLRTVLLIGVVTAMSVAIAVPLAWLTMRTNLPLRRLVTVASILPLVIPSYVAAFVVVVALGPRGMLQQQMEALFGIQRLPEIYGLPGAALVLSLLSYPYVLLTVRAALARLDPSLEEAARGLGQGAFRSFRTITLPLLKPAVAAGALLVALYTLSDFGAVSLLRYETFTLAIFVQYGAFDRTAASALSLVLVGIAFTILFAEGRTRGRGRYHRSGGGAARPAAQVDLGRWRWPALGAAILPTVLGLALPLTVLTYWLVRGVAAGEPLLMVWGPAWNSVYVSALAAVAVAVAALPVAILAARYRGGLSAVIERATYTGFALPGVVVALALVFFGVNVVYPLYQTTAMLVFAYLVLFLPAAVGATRTSLLQVSPRIEEAARGLGSSSWRVALKVTLPLALPGMLSGAAMVFLLTMKELPATLILSPIGFETLPTAIWSAASEAFFARAAAPALLLIIVAGLPTAWLVLRQGGPQASGLGLRAPGRAAEGEAPGVELPAADVAADGPSDVNVDAPDKP